MPPDEEELYCVDLLQIGAYVSLEPPLHSDHYSRVNFFE